VDLGNGLAIDSSGSVFLDVMKLLRIDTTRSFRVACRSDESSKRITTLAKDENGTTLDSPRGTGTIVQGDDGLQLKPASGKTSMRITKTGGTYSYSSTIAFDPSSDMKANDNEIVVKSGLQLGSGLQIEWQDGTVVFNPRSTQPWPAYTVTRHGDAYFIEYRSASALLVFKVYYSNSSVYLVRNGFVLRTITISDSSILVNGKEVVTYSRG
jgi:Rieske Fe-S protein